MPTICEFLGCKVYMFYQDHSPPHIHVIGKGFRAALSIPDGKLLAGTLPRHVQGVAKMWVRQEAVALMQNWQRAEAGEVLQQVKPPGGR
ncbi:DUF4160 domain-containing protein [Neomoorella glycerini]|uniref:DUF4160 domain-containing protein n=1 Tax=Neomoorella glycerini TaxID=55779 RepID=UPI0012E1B58D|nr:DUF4160 domain-containing protein [Moorella glycerini]